MVLGIFWRRTTRQAAIAGMLVGLGLTVYYMVANAPLARAVLGLSGSGLWFGIQPVSAGVFGVSAGVAVIVLLSLLSRRDEALAR
jgi:cation/acetate symporter